MEIISVTANLNVIGRFVWLIGCVAMQLRMVVFSGGERKRMKIQQKWKKSEPNIGSLVS